MLGRLAIGNTSLRRTPQWLAVMAMVIQFIASYGHIHPQEFRVLWHGHGAPILVAQSGSMTPVGDGVAPDTDCPICASISMLGSSALPEGLRVPTPSLQASTTLIAIAAFHLTAPPHLLFDTRGPPLA